jgi:response regulator RpfG family c-di-GMP phosphodiesterase
MAKSKRGRLSSIDLLPEQAEPHVLAALKALRERKKPQQIILAELNAALADYGIKPISRSAFNRKALWLAAYGRQLEHAREIAAVVAEKLEEAPAGDVGLLLGETLKTIIFDVLSEASLSDESASMKMLAQASIALRNLEQARRMSVQTRQKIMTDFVRRAGEVVEKVAEQRGLTAETVDVIKAQILGVRAENKEVA